MAVFDKRLGSLGGRYRAEPAYQMWEQRLRREHVYPRQIPTRERNEQ